MHHILLHSIIHQRTERIIRQKEAIGGFWRIMGAEVGRGPNPMRLAEGDHRDNGKTACLQFPVVCGALFESRQQYRGLRSHNYEKFCDLLAPPV